MESGVIKDTRKTHSLSDSARKTAIYSQAYSIGLQPDVKWLEDTISSSDRKDRNSIKCTARAPMYTNNNNNNNNVKNVIKDRRILPFIRKMISMLRFKIMRQFWRDLKKLNGM